MSTVMTVYQLSQQILGFDPTLIVVVWVVVSMLSFATRLGTRTKTKDGRHFWLAVLCFVVSLIVVAVTNPSGTIPSMYATQTLKLAGASSIGYQLFKPLTRGLTRYILLAVEKRTGVKMEEGAKDAVG